MEQKETEKDNSYKKISLWGMVVVFLVVGLFGVWAVFSKIETSVQATGKVIVNSYKKIVKHPKGGVIEKIYVQEGDHVLGGDPLVQLDVSEEKSQLQSSIQEFGSLVVKKARIKSELAGKETIDFNISELELDVSSADKRAIKEEEAILHSRKAQMRSKITELKLKINELRQEMANSNALLSIKGKMLRTYSSEIKKWQDLLRDGLTDESRVYDLQRRIHSLEAEIQELHSSIVQSDVRIKELKTQIRLLEDENRKALLEELRSINMKLPSLQSRIEVLRERIKKSLVTAPGEGSVVDMKVHSAGEVVAPHHPILTIVPQNDKLVIEAKVLPVDIDKVNTSQVAEINFVSYVDPVAKPVEARVVYISADAISDPADPAVQYYKVLLHITPKGMEAIKDNGYEIVPGMPVSVFIKAGKTSFLSYILTPVQQLIKGAFRAN